MGGPNLEVFKFGFYMFFPIVIMGHYSNPEWYNKHVYPMKEKFWPQPDALSPLPPQGPEELQAYMDKKRAETIEKLRNGTLESELEQQKQRQKDYGNSGVKGIELTEEDWARGRRGGKVDFANRKFGSLLW